MPLVPTEVYTSGKINKNRHNVVSISIFNAVLSLAGVKMAEVPMECRSATEHSLTQSEHGQRSAVALSHMGPRKV